MEYPFSFSVPDGPFGEIDAAAEVGEPRGLGDAVDGGRDGDDGERRVRPDRDGVPGENERPLDSDVFEAGSGQEERGSRERGGESGADLPRLHGQVLRAVRVSRLPDRGRPTP